MKSLALALAVLVALPASAGAVAADVACVGIARPDCTRTEATLADALATSAHLIRLGPGPHAGGLASAAPVELAGAEGTVINGDLTLTGTPVALHNVRLDGTLTAGPGTVRLEDADLAHVTLENADATGRGLTVTAGIAATGGSLSLSSSVVMGADPFDGPNITTAFSAHAEDADATATDRIDPPADPRASEALRDAGDPAPLDPFEPFEDAAGVPRIAGARRDIGAYEAQPTPFPIPGSSVLVNGGAEDGLAGWSGTFSVAGYGDPFLPSAHTGLALAAGARLFTGADAEAPDLFQRIDVTAAAASIDRGLGRAALSGLLGGYGADPDALSVRAVFKDPENQALATIELAPVTAADRANDSTLLRRSASRAIPARTRAIDVLVHGERAAGTYTDAYADNLALELSVPGVPVDPPGNPGDPPVGNLKPFSGISVLTAAPRFSARGAARLMLACASETVGPCSGSLELDAVLPGRSKATRIARRAVFSVRRGASEPVVIRLRSVLRARLLRRRSLPATLLAVSHDRQGVQRRATVPLTLALPGGSRRSRAP
ncbi:MAG: hypothetical protein QOI80_2942 [Solirubrobacteraceae bacterium]|nr:hypothetical protein [Solirubrobacteraceae bacterium]